MTTAALPSDAEILATRAEIARLEREQERSGATPERTQRLVALYRVLFPVWEEDRWNG